MKITFILLSIVAVQLISNGVEARRLKPEVMAGDSRRGPHHHHFHHEHHEHHHPSTTTSPPVTSAEPIDPTTMETPITTATTDSP